MHWEATADIEKSRREVCMKVVLFLLVLAGITQSNQVSVMQEVSSGPTYHHRCKRGNGAIVGSIMHGVVERWAL